MPVETHHDHQRAPSPVNACTVVALFPTKRDHDSPMVAIPHAEAQLIVRFGASAHGGLDAHAIGARQRVYRKRIGAGQWGVVARLHLGTQDAVLGVPASKLAGRTVALEDLWGGAASQRLLERLGHARDPVHAAALMESAIAERVSTTAARAVHSQLALHAAERLLSSNVKSVALDLGVSDRHLRRIFREAIGVSPKAFAQLARFRSALCAAQDDKRMSWASIAAASGYYDQAHLIADFQAVAGATPLALVDELGQNDASTAW